MPEKQTKKQTVEKNEKTTPPANKTKSCLKIGCVVLIILTILSGLAVGFSLLYRNAKKKTGVSDKLLTGKGKSETSRLINSEYNFSVDVANLKDKITEVAEFDPERKKWYVASYNYCLDVPSSTDVDMFCGEAGKVNVFNIHVLNQQQYDENKDAPMSVLQEIGKNDNYYFMFSHPNGILPEEVRGDFLDKVKDSFRLENGSGTSSKDKTTTSGKTDEEIAEELIASAKTYYNCKYLYTFKYPTDWVVSDGTHESDKVFVYTKGINMTFTAHLNEGLTIDQWTNKKKSQYPGSLKETRYTDRSDTNGILLAYQDPDSLVFFWPYGNHIMEMYASGDNYRNDHPEAYVVGSTLQVNYTSAQCPTTTYQQPQQQGGVDPATCLHPNGDVEYWWYSASQAERDCFTAKYGAPSLLQQPQAQPTTPPQPQGGVDPSTCQHPNGDVWIWWNDASPAEQDCFMLKYPESPFFRQ